MTFPAAPSAARQLPPVVGAPWPGAPTTATEAWHGRIPLRYPRWGFGDAWIALLGAFVASVAVGSLLLLNQGSTTWQNVIVLVSLVAQWVPMLGWPLVVTRWKGNGAVLDLGLALRRPDLAWGIGGGFVVLVAAGLLGALTQWVVGDFSSAAGDLLEQFRQDPALLVLLAVGIGVIAPIVEEVCFRGLFWGALAKRGLDPWWVTFWTAIAFAAFHLEPERMPLLFVTGMLLGYLRQRTGRLGAGILAHMVNNLVGVAGLFLV